MASARINTGLAGRPHLFLSLLMLSLLFIHIIDSTAGVSGNKVAIIGETVEIECSLGENSIEMMKWELITGPKKVKVYIGKNPITDFAGRFSLSYDGFRSYNLIIRKIQKEDAGTYICRDRDEKQEIFVNADLTILETPPICNSTNIARVSIAENSCGWPNDYLYLTCKVKYIGDKAPVLVWRDINGKDVIRYANESGVVSSTIKIKSVWNQFTFTCQASQLPQNPCYIVIPKPFYAISSTEERTVSYPQRVPCSANSSHACQYRWTRDGEEVSTVQYLELESNSPPGDYQCVARCPFQETYCEIPTLLIHYQMSSCSHGWSIGMVVGTVTVTLIFVFAILGISFNNPSFRFGQIVKGMCDGFRKRFPKCWKERESVIQQVKTSAKAEWKQNVSGKGGKIKGITVLDSIIYVVRHQAKEIIEKYSYSKDRNEWCDPIAIPLTGLQEPRDLASCPETRALYISDSVSNSIYKYYTDNVKTEKWPFTTTPEGISVLETDVVVVFQSEGVIRKFNSHGKCFETYEVPAGLNNPHHAIVLGNIYFLCFGEAKKDESHGICSVNIKTTEVVKTYNGTNSADVENNNSNSSKMWPTRMARMSNGNIIVVAYKWGKILLLDANLKFLDVLIHLENKDPTRMFWDQTTKTLYVTENNDEGGISVYQMTDIPIQKVENNDEGDISEYEVKDTLIQEV